MRAPSPGAERIWTRTFTLLCGAQFLGYAQQGFLTPILPLYLASLGHTEFVVGLVLAAFSLSSFLIRPTLGALADNWSVRGVLRLGAGLLGATSAAFAVPILSVITLVNTVRGIGWAALNTGGNTLLAHLAPPTRRAEAASYVNLFQSSTTSFVPPIALWLLSLPMAGYVGVFAVSAACGLLAALLTLLMSRESSEPAHDRSPGRRVEATFLDRKVLLPSLLLFALTLAQPASSAFIPLYAQSIGIDLQGIAWFYVSSGVTALLGRALLGRVADRLGRGVSLALGFVCAGLGMLLLLVSTNLVFLVLGGVAYATATVLHLPSAMALAIDRADPRRRGAAMASYSLWFQVGMGLGAAGAGAVVELAGYRVMYGVTLLPLAAGLLLVVSNWRALQDRPSLTPSRPIL